MAKRGNRRRLGQSIALAWLLLSPAAGATSHGAISGADPIMIARAVMTDASALAGAVFVDKPAGTPAAVASQHMTVFPLDGASFGILSTGDATVAGGPGKASVNNGGGNVRGGSDYDVTVLRIDLAAGGKTCLRLDHQLLTTEDTWPGNDGGDLDAFVAELNRTTWRTGDLGGISAPDDFALSPEGRILQAHWQTEPADAYQTGYLTFGNVLRSSVPIPAGDNNGGFPGDNSVYLSIFDMRTEFDSPQSARNALYDTAVFLDNLSLASSSAANCTGTTVLRKTTFVDVPPTAGSELLPGYGASLSDARDNGRPVPGKTITFSSYLPAVEDAILRCSAITDATGRAKCGSEVQAALFVYGYRVELRFAGDATHLASAKVIGP